MLTRGLFRRVMRQNDLFIRNKHKEYHWAEKRRKKTSTQKALEHFDEFYDQIFKSRWPDIRKGLLGKQKYVAVVNNYADPEETCKMLEKRGAINMRQLLEFEKEIQGEQRVKDKREEDLKRVFKMVKDLEDAGDKRDVKEVKDRPNYSLDKSLQDAEFDTSRIIDGRNSAALNALQEFLPATKIKGREDFIPETNYFKPQDDSKIFPVTTVNEYDIKFPPHLHVYCYEEDNFTDFPQPKKGSTEVLNYYLMDGGSVLPVLALDLKPGNRVLDMCSGPGGKSLVALQTLIPDSIICNDSTVSRTNRVFSVLKQYLFDLEKIWLQPERIKITCQDGRYMEDEGFDRVLVDVPCTTDRHSLKEDENNIFRPDRVKERLKIPELQSELLFNALRLVKTGGFVVYSTCSLSPVQNDGVVHMALKRVWEETKMEIQIKNLSPALNQMKNVYKLAHPKFSKYGHLVLPNLMQNFGPTYFCKLERVK